MKFEVITEENFRQLPRWANVAFAARCARRVLHVFLDWTGASAVQKAAVKNAVSIAIVYSSRGDQHDDGLIHVSNSAAHAAVRARADGDGDVRASAASLAAESAAAAAAAAAAAGHPGLDCAIAAASAASAAAGVGGELAESDSDAADAYDAVASAQRHDYELLRETAKREHWTDDTLVSPEFFGELWPDGEPDWWPKAKTVEIKISANAQVGASMELAPPPLRVYVDPGDAPRDAITDFYVALAAYYKSLGGSGLRFKEDEIGTVIPAESEL